VSRRRVRVGLEVGEELAIDGIGDPPLQTPQGFAAGLALALLARHIGPAGMVAERLGDGHDVHGPVQRRLPPRFNRCRWTRPEEAGIGAVPLAAANLCRSAKRRTSPTSPRIRAATSGPTPWTWTRDVPVASTSFAIRRLSWRISASRRVQLVQPATHQLGAHRHLATQQPPDQPGGSLGPQLRQPLLVAGSQGDQVGMDPVGDPGPLPDQLLAVVDQQSQVLGQVLAADRWQVVLAGRDPGDGQRIGGIGLAALSQPPAFPHRQRGRHLDHHQPGLHQVDGHGPAVAAGAFDADPDHPDWACNQATS
jgi:hypothetical protein